MRAICCIVLEPRLLSINLKLDATECGKPRSCLAVQARMPNGPRMASEVVWACRLSCWRSGGQAQG